MAGGCEGDGGGGGGGGEAAAQPSARALMAMMQSVVAARMDAHDDVAAMQKAAEEGATDESVTGGSRCAARDLSQSVVEDAHQAQGKDAHQAQGKDGAATAADAAAHSSSELGKRPRGPGLVKTVLTRRKSATYEEADAQEGRAGRSSAGRRTRVA